MKKAFSAIALGSLPMLVLVLGFLAANVRDVRANGKPIRIVLTYLSGVSNWGSASATGVAEIVMKEGEVDLSVVGLPTLTDETYVAWMSNGNQESLNVATFNTDSSGTARLRQILPSEIPDKSWNLFLVTVEPKGQQPPSPGAKKSIGGYFPDSAEARQLPARLPQTGGNTDDLLASASPEAVPTATPTAPRQFEPGNNLLTYMVVVLVALGLGIMTRARTRRRAGTRRR